MKIFNIKNITIVFIVIFLLIITIFVYLNRDRSFSKNFNVQSEHKYIYNDLIMVENEVIDKKIISPFVIKGKARGNWFFEADFPVVLTNWDGLIIAEGYATAKSDWMTMDYVAFECVLEFESPELYKNGNLILQRANPTGINEFNDAYELEIIFE